MSSVPHPSVSVFMLTADSARLPLDLSGGIHWPVSVLMSLEVGFEE